jgi:predicted kinase
VTKPLLVFIVGAPGSGKSTLARAIHDRTHLPLVAKDDLKQGLWFTEHGLGSAGATTSAVLLYELLDWLVTRGVSVVVDHAMGPDEVHQLTALAATAHIAVIECRSRVAATRVAARDGGTLSPDVPRLIETWPQVPWQRPLLVVNTDESPLALDQVLAFVTNRGR